MIGSWGPYLSITMNPSAESGMNVHTVPHGKMKKALPKNCQIIYFNACQNKIGHKNVHPRPWCVLFLQLWVTDL